MPNILIVACNRNYVVKSVDGDLESDPMVEEIIAGQPIWTSIPISVDECQKLDRGKITKNRRYKCSWRKRKLGSGWEFILSTWAKDKLIETLTENAFAGYWDWYPKSGYEYYSPAFWEMVGYEQEEKKMNDQEWQKVIHPEDLPIAFENFRLYQDSRGKIPYDQVVRYRHKDGKIVWVRCVGQAVDWNKQNEVVRMIGVHIDMTEMKTLATVAEEREKQRAIFFSKLSHELRTPVTGILGFCEMLTMEKKGKNPYLHNIHQCAEMLLELVNDVLDYEKAYTQQMKLHPEPVSPQEIANSVLKSFSKRIKAKRISASMSVSLEVPSTFYCDGVRLFQVISNLVSNAVKVVPHKGGRIRIEIEADEDDLLFRVCDNGFGIPKESLEKVFEPFVQVHSKIASQGTGLGLPICKIICELMHGTIKIESQPGCTEVTVRVPNLPASEDVEATFSPEELENPDALADELKDMKGDVSELKVMIVEDMQMNQKLLRHMLKKLGLHDFVTVSDGVAALQQKGDFDLIITDINMPRMGGLQLTETLRKNGSKAWIVGLSADILTHTKEKLIEVGMNDFVSKPFKKIHLEQALAKFWLSRNSSEN
jgi:PAS domain S-box-containing protein